MEQAQHFSRLAALAQHDLERDDYTRLAAGCAHLAADAARFEAAARTPPGAASQAELGG